MSRRTARTVQIERVARVLCLFLLFCNPVFAWNSIGHRIVAQIAYDQLTPTAKQKIDALTDINFHSKYPEARFLRAAIWPDQIRKQAPQYSPWHFIDIPYVKDNIKPPVTDPENVVTEIMRAEKIVADTSQSNTRRAKYLSFLIHFVGDIHQPLHCVTLYDNHFPNGDKGGNLYPIVSPISDNLHWYWDEGLGILYPNRSHYQFHYKQIEAIAKEWMTEYPPTFFGSKLENDSPQAWAQESHAIAVNFIYTTPMNAAPNAVYVTQGQTIVREQIVLAGDRLAAILNQIFR